MTDKNNRSLAWSMAAIAAGMVMLSFASAPLYQLFCKVTGFGGTTGTAIALPDTVLDREIVVSFNADVDSNLPWTFKPLQRSVKVRLGELMLAAYEARNDSSDLTKGMATYNVTPHEMGKYFHKIQCFCFDAQTLPPHTVVNMPVSFFIDPKMDADPELDGVKYVTLSYTFFPYQDTQ